MTIRSCGVQGSLKLAAAEGSSDLVLQPTNLAVRFGQRYIILRVTGRTRRLVRPPRRSLRPMSRRTLLVFLSLLALFLFGALGVLSAVSWYLAIHPTAYLTEPNLFTVQRHDPVLNNDTTTPHPHPNEKIPRILHQTWREEILPERWRGVSEGCKNLMPD